MSVQANQLSTPNLSLYTFLSRPAATPGPRQCQIKFETIFRVWTVPVAQQSCEGSTHMDDQTTPSYPAGLNYRRRIQEQSARFSLFSNSGKSSLRFMAGACVVVYLSQLTRSHQLTVGRLIIGNGVIEDNEFSSAGSKSNQRSEERRSEAALFGGGRDVRLADAPSADKGV